MATSSYTLADASSLTPRIAGHTKKGLSGWRAVVGIFAGDESISVTAPAFSTRLIAAVISKARPDFMFGIGSEQLSMKTTSQSPLVPTPIVGA